MKNTKTVATTTTCTAKNFTILDFMNPSYFDLEHSFNDTDRHMYCFVFDINKMGEMSDNQREQAWKAMRLFTSDKIMLGNSTLLFEMEDSEGFDPAKEVNVCVYDLDFNEVTDRYMRWDKNHSYNAGTERFPDQAWGGRKQLYTEWERLGKALRDIMRGEVA